MSSFREDLKIAQENAARAAFSKTFGYEPETINGAVVACDGVTLRHDGFGRWRVLGVCPACGEEAPSVLVSAVTQVAALVDEFEPDPQKHQCPRSVRVAPGIS